jgi:hypothetical protein
LTDNVGVKIIPVAHLEGMASLGLIEKYWVEDCDYSGAKRFHAITKDGEHVATKCVDERGAKKVELYLLLAKQLSSELVEEVASEIGEEKYVEDGD